MQSQGWVSHVKRRSSRAIKEQSANLRCSHPAIAHRVEQWPRVDLQELLRVIPCGLLAGRRRQSRPYWLHHGQGDVDQRAGQYLWSLHSRRHEVELRRWPILDLGPKYHGMVNQAQPWGRYPLPSRCYILGHALTFKELDHADLPFQRHWWASRRWGTSVELASPSRGDICLRWTFGMGLGEDSRRDQLLSRDGPGYPIERFLDCSAVQTLRSRRHLRLRYQEW